MGKEEKQVKKGNIHNREVCYDKKMAEFLMEIFLSDKIVRKTKIFPIFLEIFPFLGVITLLPGCIAFQCLGHLYEL